MAQDIGKDSELSPEIGRLSAQLARDPNSKLFIPLAEEYMKADMAEEAIMTLEEGLKAHSAYMSARVLLGKAHLQKGDLPKACEQFETVIKAVPDNLFAHRKLGEIYLAQGRRDEALKAYKILSLLSPKDEELSGIISQLESGVLPESPLAASIQKLKEEPPSEPEAVAQPEAETEAGPTETPGADTGQPEEEALEGAAPVYEIEEEVEMEPEGAPEGPTPLDLGTDVSYLPGDTQAFEPEGLMPANEESERSDEGGVYDLGADMGTSVEPEGAEQDQAEYEGVASATEEIQELFMTVGGHEEEEPAEAPAGVYELDEPSDIDLEELGVKPAPKPGPSYSSDMPFEVEGEHDSTVPAESPFETSDAGEIPSDMPFDMGDVPEPESAFEDAGGADAGEISSDMPFDMGDVHEPESAFDDAGVADAGEIPSDMPFDMGDVHEPESAVEVVEPALEEAAPAREPIHTDTLADLYIKQGFYDRAINIYKEMLKENPADPALRQKLEELYMLAGTESSKKEQGRPSETFTESAVEPADFVLEQQPPAKAQTEPSGTTVAGQNTVDKLEQFLDNIKRKGRQ